jgi:hypothetical protein
MKEIFMEKEQEDAKYPLTSSVWVSEQCQKSMKKEPEDAKYKKTLKELCLGGR